MSGIRPQATDYHRDDRATVAVFATVLASVTAALCYATRSGFSASPAGAAVTLGLSLFISVSPFVVWRVSARGHYDEPQPWWLSQAALMIVAVAITALSGSAALATGLTVAPVLAALGFLSAFAALVLWGMQGAALTNLGFLAGSAVFAIWASGVALGASGTRMAGPELRDALSLRSPCLAVIVVPLFFAAVLLLAVEMRRTWSQSGSAERHLRSDYTAWLFLVAVSIGLIPTYGLDVMGIGSGSVMFDESPAIAVPLFILALASAIAWWRTRRTSRSIGDFAFLFVFAPLLLVAIGFTSVALMVLLLSAAVGVAFLGRLFRDRLIAASAVVCVAVSAGVWMLVPMASHEFILPVQPGLPAGGVWWPYFALVHSFWGWLYVYLRLREENLATVGAIRGAALEGKIPDLVAMTMVLLGVIAGWVVSVASGAPAGSAANFHGIDRWLALSLLMASGWRWLEQWRRQDDNAVPQRGNLGSVRISRFWIIALAVPLALTVLLNALRATLSLRH